MYIGIPMQIVESRGALALCEYRAEKTLIDMSLVGEQGVGTWLLVFLNTAREIIEADEAKQLNDALETTRLAMQGSSDINHLFADLDDREPERSEFLR